MLSVGMYLADRYEIVGKVGAGGMSDVYKAKDHILGRFVAIKVLKQEYSEDRNFVAKFRSEAQSAAGLEHPNIVNIYDVGSEEGLHYIVMEYVEGITLKTYIEKKSQLSFKESVSIAIQVARGIETAHNKNIIHRDIKPQNIIISTEGKVKVTDFGIARAASANTISSDVMGSVHYASPEQARNGFVDGRSDIYSLGIVMYEMVTGRVPFDGDTTVAVAIQHLQEEMVSPSVYAPNIPISMEKIILKCTQKNPDRRYQTIADLLSDLRKALTSPDEDFVEIAPIVDQGMTKVISDDELSQIKNSRTVREEEPSVVPQKKQAPQPVYKDVPDDDDEDDDDDDEVLNPKMDKAVSIMGIVAAILIVVVIIALIVKVSALFSPSNITKNTETTATESQQTETDTEDTTQNEQTNTQEQPAETVTMINIVDTNLDDATQKLSDMGLSITVVDTQESDKEANTILTQNILEGEQVEVGSTIEVVVSGEQEELTTTVPSVVGYSEQTATSALENSNLKAKVVSEYNADVAAGEVISQDPIAGSSVAENSTVTLTVSKGKEQVKVPAVVGKKRATAEKKLTDKGFSVTIKEEYNDNVAQGLVISQSIAGDEKADAGTDITLVVSLGSETVYYSFSKDFTVPDGAVSVTYTLTDSEGNVVGNQSQKLSAGTTSITISKNNITTSSGTLEVVWGYETAAEDGTMVESQDIGFSGTVDFTKQ